MLSNSVVWECLCHKNLFTCGKQSTHQYGSVQQKFTPDRRAVKITQQRGFLSSPAEIIQANRLVPTQAKVLIEPLVSLSSMLLSSNGTTQIRIEVAFFRQFFWTAEIRISSNFVEKWPLVKKGGNIMSNCYKMKKGEVYVCEDCGLKLQVIKECKYACAPSWKRLSLHINCRFKDSEYPLSDTANENDNSEKSGLR